MTTLERQLVDGALIIRLPKALCFYEARARPWVEALGKIAEDLHRTPPPPIRGVLLLQAADADDRTPAWLAELRDTCLFSDLVHAIDGWRWVLSLIRNAPVPWVYAAAGDCLGSPWELALSCQRRYWYKAQAVVGFPEIAAGAFPPGGVLESLSKRAGRTRERWQNRPTQTAADALSDGLVHFCSDAASWETRATAIALEMLGVNPKSGVRDRRRRRTRDDLEMLDMTSRRAAYEQLGSVWRHERMGSHRDPAAWDYCWRLVNERAKLAQRGDLGRLICLIASRHLLSPAYQAWTAAHLAAVQVLEPLAARVACLPPLVIDLNYLAPPTDVLLRMLRTGQRLVLVAGEAKALAAALNLLYSRLERETGAAVAQSLWDRGVTWYHGMCDEGRSMVLRWDAGDRFVFGYRQQPLTFLRLEGNGTDAKAGLLEWCEDEGAEMPAYAPAVLALVADGLVRTGGAAPGGAKSLPLTVHVRSLFLEEMLGLAQYAEGDIGAIVEGLHAAGWGYAGDDEAWDRFLRTRHDAYPYDAALVQLGERPLDRATWELGSWKQAKAAAKRVGGDAPKWNPTAISQHLALFLGLIANAAAARGRLQAREAADFLCGIALGLPAVFGTPLAYLAERGQRRVEHYAMTHWPRLPSVRSSHDDARRL